MATAQLIDRTDQRLRLLVGLVVACGAISLLVSIATMPGVVQASDPPPLSWVGMVALLIAVGEQLNVRVRVRSTVLSVSWVDAVILVSLAILPGPWVVVATAAGVMVSKAVRRVQPMRIGFGVGKEATTAFVGGLVLLGLGGPRSSNVLRDIGVLALTFAVMTITDDLLAIPVISLASRTGALERYRDNWDIRQIMLLARFAVAVAAILALQAQPQLLYGWPLLVLILYLWHERWVRAREERQAWQDLANATDSFTDVDLGAVLRNAVNRGAKLFSADAIEIEVWPDGQHRLVRGTTDEIGFDGVPEEAPDDQVKAYPVALRGYQGEQDIGALRLRFRDQVKISEREQAMLHTYAAALETAVRNAVAYQRLGVATAQHAHAAAHDPLTGLPNRRELEAQATAALAAQSDGMVALVLLDLDRFKEINDTLGHVAGDRVLVEVAERLRAAAAPDHVVTRFGGDEFAVLLRRLPAPALAAPAAGAVLHGLREPVDLDGLPISVQASAGVAVATDQVDVSELVRRADVAMHQAKRGGARLVSYAKERDTTDRDRLALAGQLQRAVADGEFVVLFQPIVELVSGKMVAAEALARWRHPVRGDLEPTRFLENLERSEQLPAFTAAVLDQALAAADAWQQAGHEVAVSVNISARSLLDRDFPHQVSAALSAHDVPAARLCLELTETLAVSRLDVVDRVLADLQQAGVRLALDDFGTGWSSLAVLSRVPVHQLKIDREFVAEMDDSEQAAAVVRSTIDLGRGLGLMVVAEGVETEAQRRQLWELGAAAGQGHLFSRAVPAEQLQSMLQRGLGGAPGTLAAPLHDQARVVRLPKARRGGSDRLAK